MTATMTEAPDRATLLDLLARWIRQRPGLEFGNYGDPRAYRAEYRSIARDRDDAFALMYAVERSSMTAECLLRGFRAFSGRLSVVPDGAGGWRLDYCTGQYWPTEYRRAACAVLASALWDYHREGSMPAPEYVQHGSADDLPMRTEARYRLPNGRLGSAGDCIRAILRRELGARLQRRWCD